MSRENFCAKCPNGNSLCGSRGYPGEQRTQEPNQERIQSFLTALRERMMRDYKLAYPHFFSGFQSGIEEYRSNKQRRKIEKREERKAGNNPLGIKQKIELIEKYLLAGMNMNKQEDNEGNKDNEFIRGKGYLFEVLICEIIRYLLRKDGGNPGYDALLAFPQIDFAHHLSDHNQGGDILFFSCDESGKPINPIAIVDVTMQPVDKLDITNLEVGKFEQGNLIIPVYNVPLGLTGTEKEQEICRDFLNPVRLEVCFGSSSMDGLLFSEEVLKTANEMFRNRFVQSILLSHQKSFDNKLMKHTGKKNVHSGLQAKSKFFVDFVNKL